MKALSNLPACVATCDRVGDKPKLSFLGMVKASNPFLNFVRGQWGTRQEMKRICDEAMGMGVVGPIDASVGSVLKEKVKIRAKAPTCLLLDLHAD